MNKLGDLLAKKKIQEEEKLNNIKEQVRKELEPEIEKRVREELEKEYSDKTENVNIEDLEKKIRSKVEEELRQELKNEVIVVEKKSEKSLLSISLKEEFDRRLAVFDDIEDMEIRNYLKGKSTELFLKGADYYLYAGRVGQEVFEELGRKGSPEGLYTKWVELSGFSESTMKRYRNKWEVFSSVNNKVKPFILLLSHAQIGKILKTPEIKELIYSADEVTYEDIIYIINGEQPKLPKQPEEIKFPEEFNIDNFNNMFNNLEKLPEEKKEKFYKLLKEITRLMKSL